MADLVYNAFLEEDEGEVWYTAIAEPGCEKGSACIAAQGDTYEELKIDILQSVRDTIQLSENHELIGMPKNPSIAIRFTEEIYPGNEGESQVRAEMNCTKYQTIPNCVLGKKYSHETVEGLRAKVKDAVSKMDLNGKKIVLVLEEILHQ